MTAEAIPSPTPSAEPAVAMVEHNGKSYEKFVRWPRQITDGTLRCMFCGQIDEPEAHNPALCPATAEASTGVDLGLSADRGGYGLWVSTPVEGLAHAVADALAEANSAAEKWPAYNSAHEGFGVIAEEFQELTAHVFTNQSRRDLAAMRAEAIQLAATALRFAADVCDEVRGRR